jgi:hypothetical protein
MKLAQIQGARFIEESFEKLAEADAATKSE